MGGSGRGRQHEKKRGQGQEYGGAEGLFAGIGLLVLPFVILYILVKVLPPWDEARAVRELSDPAGTDAAR